MNSPVLPEGEEAFVKIAFNGLSSATRAGETDAIENAAFLFYDHEHNYLETIYVDAPGDGDKFSWTTPVDSHNKCAIIKCNYLPSYVAVVVNGEREFSHDFGEETPYITTKWANKNNAYYMSSSVYYDTNSDDNAATWYTPIVKIYGTENDAKADQETATVIPVERLVAQLNITKSGEQIKDDYFEVVGVDNDLVEGSVKFKPTNVFITNKQTTGYTIKHLYDYDDVVARIGTTWAFNDTDNKRSFVARGYDAAPTPVKANNMPNTLWTNNTTYAFDRRGATMQEATAVIVAGVYEIYDKEGNMVVGNEKDFWLVAENGKYAIYTDEAAAMIAMGEPEGELVQSKDGNGKWTGWMKLASGKTPMRCKVFHLGRGYYSKAIERVDPTDKAAYYNIVRNHIYNLTVSQITGIGTGIPTDDTDIVPVPPTDPSEPDYYMHMSVQVLPWTTVNQNIKW